MKLNKITNNRLLTKTKQQLTIKKSLLPNTARAHTFCSKLFRITRNAGIIVGN